MSRMRPILNALLRAVEKPYLSWEKNPERLARVFERKAKLLFPSPKGSRFEDCSLGHGGRSLSTIHVVPQVAKTGPLILYFHGGGYVFGSARTHRSMVARLVHETSLPAYLPDYRLAPAAPFPSAVEDALLAYQAVMAHPAGVILGGDSAGGGLALSLLGEILRQGLSKPVGVFCFSPLTDLSFSGDSLRKNARSEAVLPASRVQDMAQLYLNGVDPKTPTASPLYADFTGAPPVWLAVSDQEILLDDARRMTEKLQQDGVEVTKVLEHDLPHVWPLFEAYLPEARATLHAVSKWISSLPSAASER
ncbi:alpha/beta hydrolase [Roseovarius sp. EL26]|uniref:alpha/beta hydrolase n=1 Tax=Roseovarius sp. EL26 TaxID=2126672 RepID=UPI000EA394E2|nr:alpha/beta hydrolase [Roseovarius sp. EL26]